MAFFVKPASDPAGLPVGKIDLQRAQSLADALAKRRLLVRHPSLQSWARVFAWLSQRVGRKRLKTVFTWYLENLGGRYIPQAYSAKGFADKFAMIEAAMGRGVSPTAATIGDEAKAISRACSMIQWPGEEGKQQTLFIQASLDNWREFLRRVKSLRRDLMHGYAERTPRGTIKTKPLIVPRQLDMLLQWTTSPAELVENWLMETNEIAWSVGKWQGNLMRHALHPTHPRIDRRLRAYLADYSGDPNCWHKLKRKLNYGDDNQPRPFATT